MNDEILKQQGTWNATSPEQEQIVVLASTVKKLKDSNLKLSQQVKYGGPYSPLSAPPICPHKQY
eukprot:8966712-Ditylum_brightwellii.AAC.1